MPPIINVGSRFDSCNMEPNIDDVVVLPCVPATPILTSFIFINSPSICERFIIGICSFLLLSNSALS